MTNQLEENLALVLSDCQLLDHPFYRRWEAGELRRDEITKYAEQYRYFESMFPTFLRELSAQLPEGPIRDSVLDNLSDEITPPSHLTLFEKFAMWFDASDAPISPAMSWLVDSYSELLTRGPGASLAGLWAYESQGANIAHFKAEGLARHYGATAGALEFWMAHGLVEEDHAKWTFDALSLLEPDINDVVPSARLIGQAWWSFLDEREAMAA